MRGCSASWRGPGDDTPLVHMGEGVHEALLGTQAAANRATALAGATTGYAALDRMTTGLIEGDLILVAVRPSMGKTALGLGMAMRAAGSGVSTLFWSGEMAAAKLGARAAAAYAGLSTTSVFTGRDWDVPRDAYGQPGPLGKWDWDRLMEAERLARTLPLSIDVRPAVTVAGLRARARRMKRSKAGLGLIVIDYVGLMGVSGQPRSLYERTTEISRDLVALKKELGVPVVALAQLNRANEAREDKMPAMSDLRDSGSLEQDADVILLLHRPHYYLSRHDPQRAAKDTDEAYHNRVAAHGQQVEAERGRAMVIVAKNRNGADREHPAAVRGSDHMVPRRERGAGRARLVRAYRHLGRATWPRNATATRWWRCWSGIPGCGPCRWRRACCGSRWCGRCRAWGSRFWRSVPWCRNPGRSRCWLGFRNPNWKPNWNLFWRAGCWSGRLRGRSRRRCWRRC